MAGPMLEALDAVAMADIPAEELQAEYDAQYGNVEPVTEYNASHILVETEEEAQALIEQFRRVQKRVAMDPAKTREFSIFQTRYLSQDVCLCAISK